MDLNTIWFLLILVLLAGYAILDGFDLGVGVLHLFARDEDERRVHLRSIGPVWDGNEVWLLTGGGALFAAFPIVYATIFSGYYLALMLVLFALIARAVAIEFRGAVAAPRWRRAWDWTFGLGSLLPALLFGVAVGNVLRGVPITADQGWGGSFVGLLNPYALLVGLVSLSLFVMHGALWLRLKATGELEERMARWSLRAWAAFVVIYGVATAMTFVSAPHLFAGVTGRPLFWVLLVVLAGGLAAVPWATRRGRELLAFLASAVVIFAMNALCAVSLYPRLVPSSLGLERSLTIYNSSSTPRTLTVMLVVALIGMPLVLTYTAVIYRIFRGKVKAEEYGH
jgi:cytochrome bd ubiquinol oxidase subunit II